MHLSRMRMHHVFLHYVADENNTRTLLYLIWLSLCMDAWPRVMHDELRFAWICLLTWPGKHRAITCTGSLLVVGMQGAELACKINGKQYAKDDKRPIGQFNYLCGHERVKLTCKINGKLAAC